MTEIGADIIVATMVVIFLAVVALMYTRAIRSHKEADAKALDLEESIRENLEASVTDNHDSFVIQP